MQQQDPTGCWRDREFRWRRARERNLTQEREKADLCLRQASLAALAAELFWFTFGMTALSG